MEGNDRIKSEFHINCRRRTCARGIHRACVCVLCSKWIKEMKWRRRRSCGGGSRQNWSVFVHIRLFCIAVARSRIHWSCFIRVQYIRMVKTLNSPFSNIENWEFNVFEYTREYVESWHRHRLCGCGRKTVRGYMCACSCVTVYIEIARTILAYIARAKAFYELKRSIAKDVRPFQTTLQKRCVFCCVRTRHECVSSFIYYTYIPQNTRTALSPHIVYRRAKPTKCSM